MILSAGFVLFLANWRACGCKPVMNCHLTDHTPFHAVNENVKITRKLIEFEQLKDIFTNRALPYSTNNWDRKTIGQVPCVEEHFSKFEQNSSFLIKIDFFEISNLQNFVWRAPKVLWSFSGPNIWHTIWHHYHWKDSTLLNRFR